MIPQIAGMLKDIGRESLVILYTHSIDRSLSVLMRQADHIIETGTRGQTRGVIFPTGDPKKQ